MPLKVLILAGGFGTRLAHLVPDVPKPMAPVAGCPFLEILIRSLADRGFRDFVLMTGHMGHVIESHFGDGSRFGVRISCSAETRPLGTGGAILQAIRDLPADEDVIVVNGDTYFDADFGWLVQLHRRSGAPLTMALKYREDTRRYGSVVLSEGQVTGFREKSGSSEDGYINGGIYILNRKAFTEKPGDTFSFETQTMPRLLKKEGIAGVPFGGRFIDIGVPEDYRRANDVLPEWIGGKKARAAFLDRDGVITADTDYTFRVEDMKILEGVVPFLKALQDRDYRLVIVTNQSGIARGKFTVADYRNFQDALVSRLSDDGVKILDTYYCPFHPAGNVPEFTRESLLRKPAPGMILEAADRHGIDLNRSFMVGDKDSDRIDLPYLRSYILKGRYPLAETGHVYRNYDEILEAIKRHDDEQEHHPQ